MERARKHQRLLSVLAFGLLALVAELLGRSLTHRIDIGRHVRSPAYAGADCPSSSRTCKGAVLKDLDGTDRLYVGQTVDELYWHVYAGVSKKAVYAPARAALRDHVTSGL